MAVAGGDPADPHPRVPVVVVPVKITRKLGLLVGVPLVAVVAFAALAVVTTGGEALRAEGLRRLVATGTEAGALTQRLQAERAGAVLVLSVGSPPEAVDAYLERVTATELVTERYEQARGELSSLPAGTAALLDRVDRQLGRLDALRDQVAAERGAASAVAFTYRIVIADLIAFRESVAQAGGAPADVADRLRAAAALSQATEQVGRQQVAVLRAVDFGRLTPAAAQEITGARTGHLEALSEFDGLARPRWRAALEQSATGQEALAAQRLEDRVARARVGSSLQIDRAEWTAAMDTRMQRLREVEAGIDTNILDEVTGLRDAQRRSTGGQIGAVLLAVAAAVGLAAALGRPVVRGLRRLRDAAHEVAFHRLPAAVGRLEHQEALGGLSPDQFADQAQPPVQVRGKDELAEVGVAFNTVHREAVRTAAEQAQLRLSIASIMLNLARRGQKLTGRLTAALDDVERDELDPRRLSQLYQLDLMATLLGGTNESLLVLGGGGAAQVRTTDESLADVLQGALGRVEQYPRIEAGVVDDGVVLRASVVDDVVKLLAELLDNACRYSPPETPVQVDARWLSDRVIFQVADEGIGIDPARRDQLNRRLATRPPLDLAAVEAMGLTVVAYLAARHQIRVELREGHRRGTLAEVTLPPQLVAVGVGRRLPVALPRPRTPAVGSAPAAPLFQRTRGHPRVPPAGQPAPGYESPPAYESIPAPRPGRPDLPWPPGPAPARSHPPAAVHPGAGGVVAGEVGAGAAGTGGGRATPPSPPIYEQVRRSRWFTPVAPAVASAGAGVASAGAGVASAGAAVASAGAPGGARPDGPPNPDPGYAGYATPVTSWQTPADAGWQAAARAASPEPAGTTHSGLPVRRPGAQLVPGGVDAEGPGDPGGPGDLAAATASVAPPAAAGDWRDPVQVSAVAAAYSRGLSTGRAQHATLARSPAGSQPTSAGYRNGE